MEKDVCRVVSSLLICVAAAGVCGCFVNHNRDDVSHTDVDGGTVDADASGSCTDGSLSEVEFTAARYAGDIVPDRPFTMETSLGGCYCGASSRCSVEVDAPNRIVTLTHQVCEPAVECFACRNLDAVCNVPGLGAGSWTVRGASGRSFPLLVGSNQLTGPTASTLESASESTDSSLVCSWPGASVTHDTTPFDVAVTGCAVPPFLTPSGRVTVSLARSTTACFDKDGPCEIVNLGGGRLQVTPRTRSCDCASCGVCPPTIFSINYQCETPELDAGEYELVDRGGALLDRLIVPAPASGDTVYCAGSSD